MHLQSTGLLVHAGSGISNDIWTSYAGIIMAISVVPFFIVQLPQILHSNSGRHLTILIALIVSVSSLISYCVYQVLCMLCYLICLVRLQLHILIVNNSVVIGDRDINICGSACLPDYQKSFWESFFFRC